MTNEIVIQKYLDQLSTYLGDLQKKDRLRFLTEYEETLLDQYTDYCKLNPLNSADDFVKTLESPKNVASQFKTGMNYKKTFKGWIIGVFKHYQRLSMNHPILGGSILGLSGVLLILLLIYQTAMSSTDNYYYYFVFSFNYFYGSIFFSILIILALIMLFITVFSLYGSLLKHMSYGITAISTYIFLLWFFDLMGKIFFDPNTKAWLSSSYGYATNYTNNFVPTVGEYLDPSLVFHDLLGFLLLVTVICLVILILRILIKHEKNVIHLLGIGMIITILIFTFFAFSILTTLNPFFYVPTKSGTYYIVDVARIDGQVSDNFAYARPIPVLGNLITTNGGVIQVNRNSTTIIFGYANGWYAYYNSNTTTIGTLPATSFPWSWTYANKSAWDEHAVAINGTIINATLVQSKISDNYYIETHTKGSSVMNLSVDIISD